MKVKNIIFDLGGVVIDLDRSRAVKALDNLGMDNVSSLLGEYGQKGDFYDLEAGLITSAQFFDKLLQKCNKGTKCDDIANAFEKFLVDIPLERLKMLDELRKKGYKLFVLSNTNPIMFDHWIKENFKKEGKTINDYFIGIITSYQEGLCKPDPRLFRRVVDRYDLNPEETLMLDDSVANIDAARSVGLQAIQIHPTGENSMISICNSLL